MNLASAAVDTQRVDDTFQTNSIVQYTKSCTTSNGTFCSSAANCNYTFYNLDSSIKKNNVPATNVGSDGASLWQYNVSYPESGVYRIDMICSDGSNSGSSTFYAQVTGSGFNESFAFFATIFILGIIIIFLGFYLSNPPITILGSFVWVFLGLCVYIIGWNPDLSYTIQTERIMSPFWAFFSPFPVSKMGVLTINGVFVMERLWCAVFFIIGFFLNKFGK